VSQDRYRCRCGKVIATKRKDVVVPKAPAQTVRIEVGRLLIVCGCGQRRWIGFRPAA
jgi:hypothetical protein